MMTERPHAALPRFWYAEGIFRRHEPALVWLGVMLYLGLVKLILDTWLPGAFADPDQAALFAWPAIGPTVYKMGEVHAPPDQRPHGAEPPGEYLR